MNTFSSLIAMLDKKGLLVNNLLLDFKKMLLTVTVAKNGSPPHLEMCWGDVDLIVFYLFGQT